MSETLASDVKNLWVTSCADGSMRIDIEYHGTPLEEGCCPAGVLTRMAVARQIETVLKSHLWDEVHGS